LDNEAVRLAIIGKLGWIKRQQAKFERQPRESPPSTPAPLSNAYFVNSG
jgi:predicted metal-dependent hydrolase